MWKVIERHKRHGATEMNGERIPPVLAPLAEKHSSQRLTSIPSGQIPEHLATSNTLREDREGEREEDPLKARGRPRAYNLPTDRWQ